MLPDVVVLFPFKVPIPVPRIFYNAVLDAMSACRIIPPRRKNIPATANGVKDSSFVRLEFSMSFSTAPLIADLFLLAISAIGRQEVHDGTVGADHISPIDIMVFFITLAYIAISIDASGLIRYLAFRVLQKGGKVGHLLFFYLYAFFFSLGTFIGNDPIILSGTAFLAYMTRVSSNIDHPRAWMFSQFAIANIASAILVSSNPTNLVLAGAFKIRFIVYTANMIVPVAVTAIVLFPFLLYVVFASPQLIPLSIEMEKLSEEQKAKTPINPNIPHARGKNAEDDVGESDEKKTLALEEIMNPFLDKGGAAFGAVIMAVALITLLAINAASQKIGEHPVFWVTLPAAFIMFCWDIGFGWKHRKGTRKIAKQRREDFEKAEIERAMREEEISRGIERLQTDDGAASPHLGHVVPPTPEISSSENSPGDQSTASTPAVDLSVSELLPTEKGLPRDRAPMKDTVARTERLLALPDTHYSYPTTPDEAPGRTMDVEKHKASERTTQRDEQQQEPTTLVSLVSRAYRWSQDTFPTVVAVIGHLPFKLVPFALAMFVLIQGLVTKGWVPVFAHGWDHWSTKTGTIGSIGGMGFLSVVLCNVSLEIILAHQPTTLADFLRTVCGYQHRHHYFAFPYNPSVAGNPSPEWNSYQ